MAKTLGITGKRADASVGIRLSWMKRYGAVQRHPTKPWWHVTDIGESLANGELNARQRSMVEDAEAPERPMLTRAMTKQNKTRRMDSRSPDSQGVAARHRKEMMKQISATILVVITIGLAACGVLTPSPSKFQPPPAPTTTTTTAPAAPTWTIKDVQIGKILLTVSNGKFGALCATQSALPGGTTQFRRLAVKYLGGYIVQYGGDVSGTIDYMLSKCVDTNGAA